MNLGIYIGTIGTSMWVSEDGGEEWLRPYDNAGLYLECRVFSMTSQPDQGVSVLLGTDQGLYRWLGRKRKWEQLPTPFDAHPVWAIEQSPHNPAVLLAGTRPAAFYRSEDSGKSWTKIEADLAQSCKFVEVTRVTRFLFDSHDANLVWASLEIGGVWRSRDGGRTWGQTQGNSVTDDIHGLCEVQVGGRRKLFATTNKGLFVSWDDGDSWEQRVLNSPLQYTRSLVQRADASGVMFLTNGDGPPGTWGRLFRSNDYGETWQNCPLPCDTNSTMWCVAVHRSEPKQIYICSNFGQIWKSKNGGDDWTKLKREFGEIRSMMLRPLEGG